MKLKVFDAEVEMNKDDYNLLNKIVSCDFVGLIGGDWIAYWRWKNLVKIAGKVRQVCDEQKLIPKHVSPKFVRHFFEHASLEEDDALQDIWAKILAGEIKQPKSFSLRTLEAVKNMSLEEARLFEGVSKYFVVSEDSVFLPNNTSLLKKHGVTYSMIMKLEECGMITSQPLLSLNFEIDTLPEQRAVIYSNKIAILIMRGSEESKSKFSLSIYMLSAAGKELLSIMSIIHGDSFMLDYARILKNEHDTLSVSAHRIDVVTSGKVQIQAQDMLAT